LPEWKWKHNADVCETCQQNLAKDHYTCKGPCGQKKCKKFFSQYFATTDRNHGDQKCDVCEEQKKAAKTQKQEEKNTRNAYSDVCPRCKCTIKFDEADTKSLDHTHDDGKGGQCRFRGAVKGGRLEANLHLCPDCHMDSRTHHIACHGKCSGAKHCKSKFSIYFQHNKSVHGKQQCDKCVSSKTMQADTKKRCFKCKDEKTEAEYTEEQWNLTGKNANRRKCCKCWKKK